MSGRVRMLLVLWLVVLSHLAIPVNSQISLYIPGFDPQPVSADVIGVGGDGRTTWALHRGRPSAGDTSVYDFPGTATLVQGPNDASLTYADAAARFTIGQMCTISGSESTLAICTIVAGGSTATQTEVVTRVGVQGGRSLILTMTSTSGSGARSGSAISSSSSDLESDSGLLSPTPSPVGPSPAPIGTSVVPLNPTASGSASSYSGFRDGCIGIGWTTTTLSAAIVIVALTASL